MHSSGYILITEPGKTIEHDTLQCCHCGQHFIVRHGSGTVRGFCTKCNKVTCGSPACLNCVPYEKQIEIIERKARL